MTDVKSVPANRAVIWTIHAVFTAIIPIYMVMFAFAIAPSGAKNTVSIVSYMPVILALVTIPLGFVLPLLAGRMGGAGTTGGVGILLVKMILSDAIFEAVAIYGMIGPFLGTPLWICYGLMGLSFALLAVNSLRIVQEP